MNLDESFTAKLKQRAKARKDYLKVKMMDNSARRQRNVLIEEQQIPDEDNKEHKEYPKHPHVEEGTLEHQAKRDEPIEEVKENVSLQEQKMTRNNCIKKDKLTEKKVPIRARDLDALRKEHSAQDGLNERYMSQDTQQMDKPPAYLFSAKSRGLYSTRNRLARLAADINGWEDNLKRPVVSATSSTEKAPAVEFKAVEDTLNCSFEPSNLPMSARKAIFEQVATDNVMTADINGWEDNLMQPAMHTTSFSKEAPASEVKELEDSLNSSFEPSKLPLSERKAIFEQAATAADINGWKDNLTRPFVPTSCIEETSVAATKKVEDILNSSFEPSNLPLSARKAIFEQAAVGNKVQSEKQTFKSKVSMTRRSAAFEKSPRNKFRFRTPHQKPTNTSPINPSANVGNPLKPVSALKGSPSRPSTASTRSPTNPSIASTGSSARPTSTFTRSSSKPSIASIGRSARQSATLSRSSSKSSITSTKSPVILSSTLTKGPCKPSTALTISPIKPSAALTKNLAKLSIATTKNHAKASASLTRSPTNPSIASAGDPAFSRHSPAKPEATGGYTTTTTKSPILKPPTFSNQQQWAKATGTKPKIKQPLSRLVNHWEKLSSSSSCTSSQVEEEVPSHAITAGKNESYLSEEQQDDYLESEYEEEPAESEYEEPRVHCEEQTYSEYEETQSYSTYDEEESGDDDDVSSTDISSFDSKKFKAAAGIVTETENEDRNSLFDCCSVDPLSDGDCCYPSRNLTDSSCGRMDRDNRPSHQPLLHSVSVYRKLKRESCVLPVPQERVPPLTETEQERIIDIQQTIKSLQEEVLRQHHRIGQSHQLINYLTSTKPEFCGSIEEAEAEKLLLTATQKHQACLNEIQRLKSQGCSAKDGHGTLTIKNMELPLKRSFVAAQLEGKTSDVHYFLCLVRHRAQVIETKVVSTDDEAVDDSLHFTNLIKLKNLPPDFSVVFEVFTLQTIRECPSGIRRDQSKIRQSLRRKKGNGKLPGGSSGGPHTVRSLGFRMVGYTCLTVQNCMEKRFTLNKVPFTSPLQGVLKVELQLHAEYNVTEKGFLTMFRDVSGFGAWYRRWCSLENHLLSYWMYPDDEESKKDALGIINLRQCTTHYACLVSRDICARPHTFQLVEVRPRQKGDRDTLISYCHGNLTTTKHLLSADTKEEQERWCQRLNDALRYIHLWSPKALTPTQ